MYKSERLVVDHVREIYIRAPGRPAGFLALVGPTIVYRCVMRDAVWMVYLHILFFFFFFFSPTAIYIGREETLFLP